MRQARPMLISLLLALFSAALSGAAARGEELTLPVPVVTIYPGEMIDEAALTERGFSRSRRGWLAMIGASEGVVGKVARRTLLPGRPIPAAAVAEPDLVRRGAPVRLVFREGGLLIVAQATSLQGGGAGDVIRVRNLDSGLILAGTVQPDGTVRVGFR